MLDHDEIVGNLLDTLDELGIADNTIVMYSTDNGPHMNSWPDAGMTPFRNEKNSNWEGAYRVPAMVRWPGHDPYERADITSNTYYDWMLERVFVFTPAQAYVASMLQTLIEFPQRQKSASFNLEQVMEKLQAGLPDS